MLPVVHSFACFLTPRAERADLQQRHRGHEGHLRRLRSPGIVPGGPGHSHQSIRDIALMGCVPGMACLEPVLRARGAPLRRVGGRTRRPGPVYLRFVSVPWELGFEPPRAEPLAPGRGTVAARRRRRRGRLHRPRARLAGRTPSRTPRSCSCPGCATSTARWLEEVAGGRPIVVLDNHWVRGGQGDAVQAAARAPGRGSSASTACRRAAPTTRSCARTGSTPPRCATRLAMTTYLFWDIDGTLLTTARAGIFALEEAARRGPRRARSTSHDADGRADRRRDRRGLCGAPGDPEACAGASCAPTSGCCPSACTGARAACCPTCARTSRRFSSATTWSTCCSPATSPAAPRPSCATTGCGSSSAPAARSAWRAPTGRRSPAARRALAGDPPGERMVRHRRHAARRLLRQGDRRAHRRGRQRPVLRARRAARARAVGRAPGAASAGRLRPAARPLAATRTGRGPGRAARTRRRGRSRGPAPPAASRARGRPASARPPGSAARGPRAGRTR